MSIALCCLLPVKHLISLLFFLFLFFGLCECLKIVALGFCKKVGKGFLNSEILAFLSLNVNSEV